MKEVLKDIMLLIGVAICAFGGFLLILMVQPWFWLAIITIMIMVYIF